METLSIVIAEHGANWLHWAQALRRRAGALMLLAQEPDEPPDEFAQRVSQRIGRLAREGQAVEHAAFVASHDGGVSQDRSHRSTILRRLSAVLTHSGRSATLYLDPAGPPAGPTGVVMRALAWAIRDLAGSARLSIAVGGVPPCEPVPC